MANVRVMADSVAGIPAEMAEEYHIKVIPAANIIFDKETYLDGVTINAREAYELLKKAPDKFTTSAVEPERILEAYRELGSQTSDILFVTISSELSAVIKTATIAMELYQEEKPGINIRLLDSRSNSSGQGLVTLAAARAAQQGMDLEQTASYAQQVRQSMGCYILLDTLRYAYRTGRISKTSAKIAALFGIKPINRVSESGTVDYVERVRKREAGVERIIELIKKEMKTDELHFMVMHADAPDAAGEVSERLKKEFKALSMIISDYSPVMGYGAGPGALSIAFHPEMSLPVS